MMANEKSPARITHCVLATSCLEMESNMYLEIKNISKTIKGNRVLDDISASMECGKIYGFRGQNGSGKTMLMRCICGLVIPDNGAIIVDGDELGKRISFPESLGALIESPGFIEHYSALDNMRAIALLRSLSMQGKSLSEMTDLLNEQGFVTSKGCQFQITQVKRLLVRVGLIS